MQHSIAGLLLHWPHDCLSCVWACAVCSRLQLHFVISNYLSVCGLRVVVCCKYMDGKVSLIGRTNFSMLCFEKLRLTHLLKEKAKSLFFLLFFWLAHKFNLLLCRQFYWAFNFHHLYLPDSQVAHNLIDQHPLTSLCNQAPLSLLFFLFTLTSQSRWLPSRVGVYLMCLPNVELFFLPTATLCLPWRDSLECFGQSERKLSRLGCDLAI